MADRYFLFYDQQSGLWSYDETTGAAANIVPFSPSPGGAASIGQFAVAGNVGYFTNIVAGSGANQIDLWKSNGTGAGTSLVTSYADANPTGADTPPVLVGLSNGDITYEQFDGTSYNLYLSAGTAGSTHVVSSYTGNTPIYFNPGDTAEVGGNLLFVDSYGGGLWSLAESGGTATNIASFSYSGTVDPSIAVVGGEAYVSAVSAGGGGNDLQIWASDGTAGGTSVVASLADNSGGAFPDAASIGGLTALSNGQIAFEYIDGVNKYLYLLSISGGGDTASSVSSFTSTAMSSSLYLGPSQTAEVGGDFLFVDQASGLWSLNESTGTATNIAAFSYNGAVAPTMVSAGGAAYFTEVTANTGGTGNLIGLWTTDGTQAGTSEVASFADNTPPANLGADTAGLAGLTALGTGGFAFSYYDGTQYELFVSDGTTAGTSQVSSFNDSQSFALTAGQTGQIACFVGGTRVRTPQGWMAVEDVAAGDVLVTHFAGVARVVWVGSQTIEEAGETGLLDVSPVRITAGAFGPDVPLRDVLVSPDHAIFVDGVLIPAKRLVNGQTLRREAVARVTYYHIELTAHDVLDADGLPAESYLHTGNDRREGRGLIRDHAELCARVWEGRGCAPLVVHGPLLDAVRARLARGDVAPREVALAA